MTVQTGRTTLQWVRCIIGDTSNVLREIPIDTPGTFGLTSPEVDVSAIQDVVDGLLAGRDGFEVDLTGPFDTTPAAAIATTGNHAVLSGSYTILQPLRGLVTPRSFAFLIGMNHDWETGEPVFGISRSSTSGVWVSTFQGVPKGEALGYKSRIRLIPGSSKPTWGTSIIT